MPVTMCARGWQLVPLLALLALAFAVACISPAHAEDTALVASTSTSAAGANASTAAAAGVDGVPSPECLVLAKEHLARTSPSAAAAGADSSRSSSSPTPESSIPGPLLTFWSILRAWFYILFAALFTLWWNQSSLLYMPTFGRIGEGRLLSSNARGFKSPAEYGMRFEEVWLNSGPDSQGRSTLVHAWLILLPGELASSAPTLLFFHGNAGNIGYRLPNIRALVHVCRTNVMIVDYRGYGQSAGEPSQQGLEDDAVAALAYLRSRAPGSATQSNNLGLLDAPTIDPTRLHVFGRSLGGAVALHLAAKDAETQSMHPAHPPLAGVIVENSFASLEDMVLVLATRLGLLSPLPGEDASHAGEEGDEAEVAQALAASLASAGGGGVAASAGEGDDDAAGAPAGIGSSSVQIGSNGGGAVQSIEGPGRRALRSLLRVLITNPWRSLDLVSQGRVRAPLLFVSGLADELVPAAHMASLHAAALAAHAGAPVATIHALHPVPRGTHNDTHVRGGVEYYARIAQFFEQTKDFHAQHSQQQQQSHSAGAVR